MDISEPLGGVADSSPAASTLLAPHIRTEFHPSSGREPLITLLDGSTPDASEAAPEPRVYSRDSLECPYAPFASRQDFEFAEFFSKASLSKQDTNILLDRLHNSWSPNGSVVSFRTYDHVLAALEQARCYVPDVRVLLRRFQRFCS